jgi:hypothetical protein
VIGIRGVAHAKEKAENDDGDQRNHLCFADEASKAVPAFYPIF